MQEDVVEPVVQQSFLMWYMSSLGLKYAVVLPVAGMFSLLSTLLIVIRGRGPFVSGGLILAVAAPVFLGLVGAVDGVVAVYQVIGMATAQPKPSELGEGISMALVALQVGTVFAIPSFGIAAIGSLVRALTAGDASTDFHPASRAASPPLK